VFRTVLVTIITLIQLYVFWRAATVPFIKTHVPLKIHIFIGFLLWSSFFFGRVYGQDGDTLHTRILELFGMNWMATLFLIFVLVLAVDIVTCFGFLIPSLAPSLRGAAILAGLLLALFAMFQGIRPPIIQSYEIGLKDLPDEMDGKRIVVVSDLHIGSLLGEEWLDARVNQVINQRPDLVFFLGDIFEGHGASLEKMVPILSKIKPPLGSWAVTGNHEFHGNQDESMGILKEAGFRILHDEWVQPVPGFILAGVDDLTTRRRAGMGNEHIQLALKGMPQGASIFLSHSPLQTDKAADHGVDLMLSGHTHGGQIWPFGYLVRLSYPLMGGLYNIGQMKVIVSRGAGTWGPRMRLWRPGEIVRITLHKES